MSDVKLERALNGLKTSALHPLLQTRRAELLTQVQADLDAPEQICQGRKRSCAATCCQMFVALKRPELYVELIRALAGSKGQVLSDLIAGGLTYPFCGPDDSGRSLTGQLLQPALMHYAKQAPGLLAGSRGRGYDNQADHSNGLIARAIPAWGHGLLQNETTWLLNGLLSSTRYATRIVAEQPFYWLYPDEGQVKTRQGVLKDVLAALERQQPVLVGLKHNRQNHQQGHVYHQYLLLGRTGFAIQAFNPWGRYESLVWKDFCSRLSTASVPLM